MYLFRLALGYVAMTEYLGIVSINISLLIYLFYFFPQIIYNHMLHKADGISYTTQSMMVLANLLDLVYGFGSIQNWQYRLVTIITLFCLMAQKYQIYRDSKNKSLFLHLGVIIIFFLAVLVTFNVDMLSSLALDLVGYASVGLYSIYWLPQIVKNYQLKRADGFNVYFIYLTIIALICDEISSLVFSWPLPSILSPPLIIAFLIVIILQKSYYKKKYSSRL